jgi:hypothetical protein
MNTKLTNILLIILLIFNVAFVGTWWTSHHKMHHPKKTVEPPVETTTLMNDRSNGEMYLVRTLGLDSAQQKKLNVLMIAHFNLHDMQMKTYVRNQTNLFNALKDGKDSVYANRCADSLGMLKVAMEKELYMHFNSIKNICTGDQQKHFDELIDNMSKEFVHHHDMSNSPKPTQDSL